ncbi:uncharacterized protein A1O9_05734 [Exophiala aquamarina CBS 119918]|uniref:Nucleolar protein 16 n=1 Tax=Exophiala aquamarina CBS 119918 TaxID=1182545 RepID=A0A072PCL2_9EURO|nr:uncharacterized protein A1O9_05734 [Exophiala aquamarina CBS 119918]KEF57814.1 hypothetical protein A1O9_05734 [Exophiala aquamarina CBS 119918]
MGRERQKKKNRSSISKAKPKSNRTKAGKKKVNFLGNEIIKQNWDRKLTLSQNYKQLGLSSKLNSGSGGTEKEIPKAGEDVKPVARDSLAIAGPRANAKFVPEEIEVERDPKTGKIIRVIRPETDLSANPLNDPLNDLMEVESEGPPAVRTEKQNEIIAQLEAQAAYEEEMLSKKRPRHQSTREEEWISSLVEKHGDNIRAMVRDKKLNPMQQTEGDIGRRLKKWKAKQEATS